MASHRPNNELNKDCLEYIFFKIPLVRLQHLRSACKEWKGLIEDKSFCDRYAKLWACSPHLCFQHDRTLYMKEIAGQNTEWVRVYDLRPQVKLVCGGERFLCFTKRKEDGTDPSVLVMSLMSFPAIAHVPLPPIDNPDICWISTYWRVFTPHGNDGLVLLGMYMDFKIACFDEISCQFHLYDSKTQVWSAGSCAPPGCSLYGCGTRPIRRSGLTALFRIVNDDYDLGIVIYNVWNDTWNLKKMPHQDIDALPLYLLQFDERGTYILCYILEDDMEDDLHGAMLVKENDDGWKIVYLHNFTGDSRINCCTDAMNNIWTLSRSCGSRHWTMFNYNCDYQSWTQLGAPPALHRIQGFTWCTKY